MNTAAKLSAYGMALVLVATGGWAVGALAGPSNAPGAEAAGHEAPGEATEREATQVNLPGGLASSQNGYTFEPVTTTLRAGMNEAFSFRIIGPDDRPVTEFDVAHEKRMHLIVVRRDTSGFQHIHPEQGAEGLWTVPLTLPEAGSYRAFADFAPAGGDPAKLGVDLTVAGNFRPVGYAPARVSTVDGYEVRLGGDLVPGEASKVTLSVSKDGKPVTDLQPYLGAYGHLVALRQGDLAYLHVHPEGEPGDGKTAPGPEVVFYTEVPSIGDYRLFLDFQHGGKVRTAEFTVTAEGAGIESPRASTSDEDEHGGHGG